MRHKIEEGICHSKLSTVKPNALSAPSKGRHSSICPTLRIYSL